MIGTGAFWQTLRKHIKEKQADLSKAVVTGNVAGLPEYRETVGKIWALDWVLGEAANILGDTSPRNEEQEEDY